MNITLSPSGDFLLTYPSGVSVNVPNTPLAAEFIHKMLFTESYHASERRSSPRPHYPTQAEVDKFLSSQRVRNAEAKREKLLEEFGFDPDLITIDI